MFVSKLWWTTYIKYVFWWNPQVFLFRISEVETNTQSQMVSAQVPHQDSTWDRSHFLTWVDTLSTKRGANISPCPHSTNSSISNWTGHMVLYWRLSKTQVQSILFGPLINCKGHHVCQCYLVVKVTRTWCHSGYVQSNKLISVLWGRSSSLTLQTVTWLTWVQVLMHHTYLLEANSI